MGYRTPDPGNPRVQSTRDRILAAARELLAETGPARLTYSLIAERAGVTRQTLYRHWPAKSGLLVDLILEGNDGPYPEPGTDPAVVAAEWLASLRAGLRDPARQAAVLAVTAQAGTDQDSAQALAQLMADRLAALNDLLKPSGIQVSPGEYTFLYGPVLARVFFERAEVTDDFIASVVDRWLAATQAASQVTRLPPPVAFQGAVGAMGLVERVELGHVLLGQREVEDLRVLRDPLAVR